MSGLSLILREFNMTSKDLADVLGITRQTLNDWIRGKSKIPKARVKEMVEFFNLNEDYFLKDENNYTEVDRLEVRKSFLEKTNEFIEDLAISPYRFWSHQNEINRIESLIENKKLLLRLEQLISDIGRIGDEDFNMKATKNYYLLEKIEIVLSDEQYYKEKSEELRSIFKNFKIKK